MLLVAPLPAHASAGDVIRDCSEDGTLDRSYSQKELSGALDQLPSDLDEYTDCRTVIRRAQLAGAKGDHKNKEKGLLGRVNRSAPVNPDEQRHIDQASGSSGTVHIGGRPIKPGASGAPFATAGLGTDIPSYMLVALIGLGTAMLAGTVFAVRRRWPDAWRTAGTSVGSPIRRLSDGVRRGITRFRR
jgi:hypothetical protein